MQIVIDIPDGYIGVVMANQRTEGTAMDKLLRQAVIDGTPLPKGHGRLIDEQSISDYVHSHIQEINTGYGDLNNHTNRILRMIESYIDNASTIIKAESEE